MLLLLWVWLALLKEKTGEAEYGEGTSREEASELRVLDNNELDNNKLFDNNELLDNNGLLLDLVLLTDLYTTARGKGLTERERERSRGSKQGRSE